MIPWYLWALVANASICVVEYMNRSGGYGSFWSAIPYTIWPIMIAQVALFYTWRDAPKMLLAWLVFTIGNTVMRIASTYWAVGEPVNPMVLFGVLVMIAGGRIVAYGSGH